MAVDLLQRVHLRVHNAGLGLLPAARDLPTRAAPLEETAHAREGLPH